ncbi:MAG: AI-2E family transporter [Pseudomonadales bacterium]|nr:AI-2E family transporter [Pseudomonadales bacterium]
MHFLDVIGSWINRHFSNEEAIFLVVLLFVIFGMLAFFGGLLAPVLTGFVLAFLLQGLVARLVTWHVPRRGAVYITFLVFIGIVTGMLLFLFPLVSRQLTELVSSVPQLLEKLQILIRELPATFPEFIDPDQVEVWLGLISGQLGDYGRSLLETTVTQLPSLVGWLIYLVLVPISVFFFLKDRDLIMQWCIGILPTDRPLLNQVGAEMSIQIANYVRGKVIEIFIVGAVSYATFVFLDLHYAALLSFLVGVSVLIPFVGAAIVTIPVLLVGFLQWGWSVDLFSLFVAYSIIQAVDGNVLVPLLFSEAVDLHPIAIIVAVLFFGGIWGIWGVFFAIPLATLVKAILNAWPTLGEVV